MKKREITNIKTKTSNMVGRLKKSGSIIKKNNEKEKS